eukprot:3629962-Prymnesium_polylepis.1
MESLAEHPWKNGCDGMKVGVLPMSQWHVVPHQCAAVSVRLPRSPPNILSPSQRSQYISIACVRMSRRAVASAGLQNRQNECPVIGWTMNVE